MVDIVCIVLCALGLIYFLIQMYIQKKANELYENRKTLLETIHTNKMNDADKYIKKQHEDLAIILSEQSKAFPYVAGLASDYLTLDYLHVESLLRCGRYPERIRSLKIPEIRKETKALLEEYKLAEYRLNYLFRLFPDLENYIDNDPSPIIQENKQTPESDDPIKLFLSDNEYLSLSENERNQRALDNYIASHKKTSWQIGRDYEMYVGYRMRNNGLIVEQTGISDKLEDLGRDIIAHKNGVHYIIQCKYWASDKVIREKHIAQLYGTGVCYALENQFPLDKVKCVFYTNIEYSDMARQFASALSVKLISHFELDEYPRIKCKVNYGEFGKTYIYHLPMDQQYDVTIIKPNSEDMYAFTVEEAVSNGFRRAYRWHGN